MRRVIKAAKRVSTQAIRDLDSGHPSHGFEHLFGRSDPNEIKNVFQKIVVGNPRSLEHNGLLRNGDPDIDTSDFRALFSKNMKSQQGLITNRLMRLYRGRASPKILCVNRRTMKQYNLPPQLGKICEAGPVTGGVSPVAMQVGETPWILLCEQFFKFPTLPPTTSQVPKSEVCPVWNSSSLEPDPRGGLAEERFQYQAFLFIHECIHFYVPNALNWSTKPKESYFFDQGLIARQSSDLRRNPMNYQAYAGSKSLPDVYPMQCSE